MARTTRAKAQKEAKSQATEEIPTVVKKLEGDSNPPKLFILPKNVSEKARILTLDNPATSKPNRYFVCPEKGLYEFTKISASKLSPRSWLLARPQSESQANGESEPAPESGETSKYFPSTEHASSTPLSSGYVAKNPDLFVATPMDLLFVLLPVLTPATSATKGTKQMFLTLEDHLDSVSKPSRHFEWMFQHESLRSLAERRLKVVCDIVEAGDESMYRISTEKLLNELLLKARRMVENGLPASLEERFVRQALQKPMLIVKSNEESSTTTNSDSQSNETTKGTSQETVPESETQSSISDSNTKESSFSTETQASTAPTSIAPSEGEDSPSKEPTDPSSIEAPEGVPELLRLRTALHLIQSSYVPPQLRSLLDAHFTTSHAIDFSPLDAHLSELSQLRKEAVALRSLSSDMNRKRGLEEDEDVVAAREEKKRKKEEEEKRKKNESRGIKVLKKVDVSGMRKLSAFFTVKPKAKG